MASPILNVGDFGDKVASLHEKLSKQGFDVSPEEVKRRFFGPATRAAVSECQSCNRLEVTGHVDEATAAVLSGATGSGSPSLATMAPLPVGSVPMAPVPAATGVPPAATGATAGTESGPSRVEGR